MNWGGCIKPSMKMLGHCLATHMVLLHQLYGQMFIFALFVEKNLFFGMRQWIMKAERY